MFARMYLWVYMGRARLASLCSNTAFAHILMSVRITRYAKSEHARMVWDTAEAYLSKTFGFSIIDIVRNNPKSHTVYFGGAAGKVTNPTLALDCTRLIHLPTSRCLFILSCSFSW